MSLKLKQIKRGEIGLPWRAPVPSDKYFIVVPPLIAQHPWSLSKIKFLLKQFFLEWKLKNCDIMNEIIFQYPLQLKDHPIFFYFSNFNDIRY